MNRGLKVHNLMVRFVLLVLTLYLWVGEKGLRPFLVWVLIVTEMYFGGPPLAAHHPTGWERGVYTTMNFHISVSILHLLYSIIYLIHPL